jgi:hypothetical protein
MKCRHYNGALNPVCNLGVNYRDLVGVDQGAKVGFINRLPCHGYSENPDTAKCDGYAPMTKAEIKAENEAGLRKTADLLAYILPIREQINQLHKDGRGDRGSLTCPKCSGQLQWVRFVEWAYCRNMPD